MAQRNVGLGDLRDESVGHHRPGACGDFFAGLEQGDVSAGPGVAVGGQQPSGADPCSDVHVMPAGVHHRNRLAVVVGRCPGGRVSQPGCLLDRQRVNVCPEQHGWAVAVAQHPDDAATDLLGLVAVLVKTTGDFGQRFGLLHGQLGVAVEVPIQLFLPLLNTIYRLQHACDGHRCFTLLSVSLPRAARPCQRPRLFHLPLSLGDRLVDLLRAEDAYLGGSYHPGPVDEVVSRDALHAVGRSDLGVGVGNVREGEA